MASNRGVGQNINKVHDNLDGIDAVGSGVTNGHVSDGVQTISGVKTFDSFAVTPSSAPTTDYQVANKKYVDDNAGGGGIWELIGSQKMVDNTVQQVDFSSISSDYNYVKILANAKSTNTLNTYDIKIRFNDDGANNYLYTTKTDYEGSSYSVLTQSNVSGLIIKDGVSVNNSSFPPSLSELIISNNDAFYKTMIGSGNYSGNSASDPNYKITNLSGFWKNNAKITKVSLIIGTGSEYFLTGSEFTVLGLK